MKAPKMMLAPMEGVVDWLTRDLITRFGHVDYCVTEFVRVTNQMVPAHVMRKYCPEFDNDCKTASGVPVHVQLLGGDPEWLARNAERAIELGAPGIDLNFGCPAKTVNRHDGGATLLQYPERIEDIVRSVRQAVPDHLPMSAKVRLGFMDKTLYMENALAAEQGGASWLTIHARTKKEAYKPPAHWEYIADVKSRLNIPVIANGDIFSVEDFERCRQITGCENFMLGRGAIARPDLFRCIAGAPGMGPLEALEFLENFIVRSVNEVSERHAVNRTKQWLKMMGENYNMPILFEAIKRFKESESILSTVRQFQDEYRRGPKIQLQAELSG